MALGPVGSPLPSDSPRRLIAVSRNRLDANARPPDCSPRPRRMGAAKCAVAALGSLASPAALR